MSGPDAQRAVAKYRRLAWGYDRRIAPTAPLRRRAIERLRLANGDIVVEVACGTGINFPLIEERIGPSGRLIGLDLSPEMLAQARTRVDRDDWRNVTLVEAGVERARLPAAPGRLPVLAHPRRPSDAGGAREPLRAGEAGRARGRLRAEAGITPRLPRRPAGEGRGAPLGDDLRGAGPALGPSRAVRARPQRPAGSAGRGLSRLVRAGPRVAAAWSVDGVEAVRAASAGGAGCGSRSAPPAVDPDPGQPALPSPVARRVVAVAQHDWPLAQRGLGVWAVGVDH
jgi:hypothetical protein